MCVGKKNVILMSKILDKMVIITKFIFTFMLWKIREDQYLIKINVSVSNFVKFFKYYIKN